MSQTSQTDMGRGHGPELAPQAAYQSKVWGLIGNKLPEEGDSPDTYNRRHEQINDMPAHPSSFKHLEQPFHYCPGGLHPVHLWNSLDCGRYKSFTSLVVKQLQLYGWLGTAIMMLLLPSKLSQRRLPNIATS